MKTTENLRQFLLRHKERADSLLFLLSCLALGLFASNEIVGMQPQLMPLGKEQWFALQMFARLGVWLSFLAHFISYGMLSGNPWKYAREHKIQLLICLAWFPHQNTSLLHDLTNVLSLETVQLIGTLANGFFVVQHIVRNLKKNALIATGSVFLFVIITASELLMQVEPHTFPSLFDALWYSMATTTTVGYGDIVPHTIAGRSIGIVLMLSGISLAGAFIGIVSQYVQSRLGHNEENKEISELQKQLAQERDNNKRLLEALETDNQLKVRLLEALEKKEKTA